MMQYLPLLKYYSSTCQELLGSIYKTLKNCQASHKCDPLRYEVLVQMDETKELVSELIETFLHCLVFDKYDSDISVTGYYCCVLMMIVAAFRLMVKMISGNSILLKIVSTRGLQICLFMLHKLQVTRLSSNCAQHKINNWKQLLLLIFVGLFFSNLLSIHRKNSIHAAVETLLQVSKLYHSKWQVFHFLSLFCQSLAYCSPWIQPLKPY